MSADVPIWVEIEMARTAWVKVYAVTASEAAERVAESRDDRLTGRTSYERPPLGEIFRE